MMEVQSRLRESLSLQVAQNKILKNDKLQMSPKTTFYYWVQWFLLNAMQISDHCCILLVVSISLQYMYCKCLVSIFSVVLTSNKAIYPKQLYYFITHVLKLNIFGLRFLNIKSEFISKQISLLLEKITVCCHQKFQSKKMLFKK